MGWEGREEAVLDLRQGTTRGKVATAQRVQGQRLEFSAAAWGWGGGHQSKEGGLEFSGRGAGHRMA